MRESARKSGKKNAVEMTTEAGLDQQPADKVEQPGEIEPEHSSDTDTEQVVARD